MVLIFSFCKFPERNFFVIQNNCQGITEKYVKEGFDGIQIFVQKAYAGIYDDLGTETKGKYFGNELMVMSYVIQQVYKLYLTYGFRPVFTSNLDIGEVDLIYGMREGSRIEEMCNIIYIGGSKDAKDYRRLS